MHRVLVIGGDDSRMIWSLVCAMLECIVAIPSLKGQLIQMDCESVHRESETGILLYDTLYKENPQEELEDALVQENHLSLTLRTMHSLGIDRIIQLPPWSTEDDALYERYYSIPAAYNILVTQCLSTEELHHAIHRLKAYPWKATMVLSHFDEVYEHHNQEFARLFAHYLIHLPYESTLVELLHPDSSLAFTDELSRIQLRLQLLHSHKIDCIEPKPKFSSITSPFISDGIV